MRMVEFFGSQSRPGFSQFLACPALAAKGLCTPFLAIENITSIFFPIWTLGERCASRREKIDFSPHFHSNHKPLAGWVGGLRGVAKFEDIVEKIIDEHTRI